MTSKQPPLDKALTSPAAEVFVRAHKNADFFLYYSIGHDTVSACLHSMHY